MGRLLTGLFVRYVRLAARRPLLPLALTLLLCAGSVASARQLRLDPSFEALLPADTPSVLARDEARRRVGSADLYVVAVESPDPAAGHRFARAVAERLRAWPETEWAMHEVDLEVFRRNALLYMELDDLRELVDLMELRIARLQCEARGDCAETDLRTAAEARADDERLRATGDRYRGRIDETAGDRSALAERFPELRDALVSEDGTVSVVLAKLSRGTGDLEFAREVYLRGERVVAELGPSSFHPAMRAQVVGAYRSFREYDTIVRDAATASVVSLALVVVAVLLFFRRVRVVLLVALALLVGVSWTMGLTGLVHPTLNTITAFIFAILLGMGIDFAIHLCAATRAARDEATSLEEALEAAVRETLPGMLTGALTTAAALLTLTSAGCLGFREFGLIGAAGVVLCLLAALLVIPPAWALADRIRPDRRPLAVPSSGWLARRAPAIAAVVGLGLSALLLWRAPRVEFEYDFSRLRAPSAGAAIGYGRALRTGRGSSPAAILADSEEQARLAHGQLAARQAAGDERIRDIVTIETFLPLEQEAKLEELARLAALLRPRVLARIPASQRPQLEELARLAAVGRPVAFADLPEWVQRTVRERDGTVGRIGFLYTWVPREDARVSMELQRDLAGLGELDGRPVRLAYSRFVIADVVEVVKADGVRMLAFATVAVLLLLLVDLRSVTGALACLATLLLGIGWGLGAAELVGWKLGVYNMLVLPLALGLGIDGTVHVYHRYARLGPAFVDSPLGVTGLAVLASSATTVAGFAGLLVVRHQGLATIGQLAVLTVGAGLAAVLGFLPGVLVVLAKRRSRRARSVP